MRGNQPPMVAPFSSPNKAPIYQLRHSHSCTGDKGTICLSSLLSAGEDWSGLLTLVKSQLCPGPARPPPGTLSPSV